MRGLFSFYFFFKVFCDSFKVVTLGINLKLSTLFIDISLYTMIIFIGKIVLGSNKEPVH